MEKIRALFWDVGGVVLTNAWDHEQRDAAVEHFLIDKSAFEARHKELVPLFEEGRISLDEYLDRAVFYQSRTFSREDVKRFMFSLSRPKPQVLELVRQLSSKYLMATINNESRELNQYRIDNFALTDCFELFVSSCFVGMRKPDERIYRLGLDLTQHAPGECCFIDDRPGNIEGAAKVGLRTVLMKDAQQLRRDLADLGVEP
ncbi:MAG: HAD family phosphatase [Acidobacteria bacterium]|nr:HAD family phosphatase [Acidobacteriota bacterium]MBV9624793.1 HAD family phosphatase [Acidobacteriota bacterium]